MEKSNAPTVNVFIWSSWCNWDWSHGWWWWDQGVSWLLERN